MMHSPIQSIVYIDEITSNLVKFCDKPTLAVLARTSSLFTKDALDTLWYELVSFRHLLALFPNNLISFDADHFRNNTVVNRLVLRRDWSRVYFYAKRVRSWLAEDLLYVNEPLVDHLSFGRENTYVLPSLRHMNVQARSVSAVHLQTLLLPPTLESVKVQQLEPTVKLSSSMNTFFLTLADVAADSLKHLDVRWGLGTGLWPASTVSFAESLTDLFSHPLEQLTSVSLRSPGCIDADGFKALARLPALTNLHLNLRQIHNIYDFVSHQPSAPRASASTAFPALVDLYLLGEPSTLTRILTFLSPSQDMVSLGFGVHHYPQARDLTQLFEVTTSKFPSLATFQFNVLISDESEVAAANRLYRDSAELFYHNLQVISDLLRLDKLVALHLEFGVPLHLRDEDMETVARAWPRIRMLNLCSNPLCGRPGTNRTPAPVTPTLAGLFTLTESCPELKHVGLAIDVVSRSAEYEERVLRLSMPVVSRTLSLLDVGWSPISQHPGVVAALLGAAYPNLMTFQWASVGADEGASIWSRPEDSNARGWKQVSELSRLFQAVRANERMRIVDHHHHLDEATSDRSTGSIPDTRTYSATAPIDSMVVD